MPDRTPEERRHARCFHRVISGLEKGGDLRLVTLTSSDAAVNPIQRDFRRLQMRLNRRGIVQGYIKVIEMTDNHREHIHLCFRGGYIAKAYLSYLWEQIHQSPIVDIRKVKPGRQNKRGVASYLAKYMSKESFRRYSWSWDWVYKGFVATWKQGIRIFRALQFYFDTPLKFVNLLHLWQSHLRSRSPPSSYLAFLSGKLALAAQKQP